MAPHSAASANPESLPNHSWRPKAHAAREPEFREEMERFRAEMVALAHRQLARAIRQRAWSRWAAELAPTVAIEAVLAWLDAGQPDAEHAADRIRTAIMGVIQAAGRR